MFQFEITRCCTLLSMLYNNVATIYIYTCYMLDFLGTFILPFLAAASWGFWVQQFNCEAFKTRRRVLPPSLSRTGCMLRPDLFWVLWASARSKAIWASIAPKFSTVPEAMVSLRVEQFDKKGAPIENWVCFRSLQSRQVMASAPWPLRIGKLLFLKCCRTNTYFSLWF